MRRTRSGPLPVGTSLLVALVVTGCAGSAAPPADGTSSATSASTGAVSEAATGTATANGPGSTTATGPETPTTPTPVTATTTQPTDVLAWLPFGPASPQAPGAPIRVYEALFSDCAGAIDLPLSQDMTGTEAAFYQSAALLCVGAQDDDDAAWSEGRTMWAEQGSPFPVETCLEHAVADAAAALSAAGPVPPTLGGSAPGYACPPEQVDVEPRAGQPGSTVTVSWSTAVWLAQVMTVRFGGTEAEWTFLEEPSSAEYVVPEGPVGTVPVTLDLGEFGTVPAGAFTFEDDQTEDEQTQPATGTATVESGP